MIRLLLSSTVILAIFGCGTLRAQDDSAADDNGDGVISTFFSGLNGRLDLGYYQHFSAGPKDEKKGRFDLDLKLKFYGDFSDYLSLVFNPTVHTDNVGFSSGVIDQLHEQRQDRYILNVEETYLTFSHDRFDLSVGKKIYSWGVADFYNPMDNLSAMDYLDPIASRKIGVPSVSFDLSGNLFDVSAVYIPLFTPTRIPDEDSRWVGDLSEAEETFGRNRIFFIRQNPEFPTNTLRNNEFGLRLSSSTIINGWDLAISYYDGIHRIGVFRGDGALIGPNTFINITRVYPRIREIGASFSTTVGNAEIHGESAVHYTDGTEQDDDFIEYILGLNYTFNGVPFDFMESIVVGLEYADEHIFDEKPDFNKFSGTGDFVRPFQGTALGSLKVKFIQDTEFNLRGIHNFDDDDSFLNSELSRKFANNTKVTLGFDLFFGHSDTFFGQWTDNDRVFGEFTLYF